MKKIKFLSGIGTLSVFAVVALIGSLLFTSCEKEDLNATFEPGPAVISFNVKVVDVLSGDVTSKAMITGAETISQEGGYNGGTVTIKATYDGVEGTQAVTVNALKAGGQAAYNVTVVLSSEYEVTSKTTTGDPVIGVLGDATHAHDGLNWCLNNNEYVLTRNLTYKVYNVQTAVSTVTAIDLTAFVEGLKHDFSYDATLEMKVSAWAYYRAWTTRTNATTVYTVQRKGGSDTFGTVTAESVLSTTAQYDETALNTHYHYGHGHGVHGYDDNAGGGIVYPD